MDKLVDILEKYQDKSSVPASERKKKKKGKKPKRSKSKKVAGTSKEHDFSQDENHAPIVSGTATHTLDTHMNVAEGNCVVEDASDSDDNQSESSVDSDDADSDDDVGDSCDNGSDESVSDEEFYKEYQVFTFHLFSSRFVAFRFKKICTACNGRGVKRYDIAGIIFTPGRRSY